MYRVGIRELSEHTSDIIRKVREDHATYEITLRGEVVARIESVQPELSESAIEDTWNRHQALADAISKEWPEGVSATEAVREQRREL